ncbi:uncharacterized protein LOC133043052 [Dama dama]|uniref:uncharacterized protein LOC133043052 n=1 Tax=Dama dama TaxID=30532 RepID=UPI002A363CC3|nr:uncharacterized protein LOC133043052 [Dama dama]
MALGRHLALQGLCVLLLGTVVGGQDLEVRLKDGAHRCEGRVEVKHQGEWGTMDDFDWSLKDASVVCRQLGCGAAVGIPKEAYFGPGLGPIWLSYTSCEGVESAVSECKHSNIKDYRSDSYSHNWDAGVVCSGFVRLSGGDGPCSGRVEVHSGEAWIPVSDGNFTLPTAQVICAELGCGKAVSVLGHVPLRESDGRVWAEEFRCEGQEPELRVCPRVPCPGARCHHSGAAQVVCSAYSEVRLMINGSSQCEGQVEMNISGRWRALCASHWSLANANVVCRQLGCGVAISTPRGPHLVEGGDHILTSRFHCLGAESFLWSCPVTVLGGPDCSHGNTASVICSGNQTQVLPQCNYSMSEPAGSAASVESGPYCSDSRQLRLVDGGGPCAGRVEILDQGSWGTICDDGWDLDDARVVCRQLGCGEAFNATGSAHFGAGSGPIWLDDLNCTGKESQVWKCPSRGWGRHDCRHKQDAGVICSEFLALRMVSEVQQCAGWLEVFYNGSWGSVCRNPMEDITVSMICRQLGCGDSGTLNSSLALREGSRPRWVDGIHCRKTDTSLWQCPSDPWNYTSCSPKEEAYISCEGDLLSVSVCLSQPCRMHRQLRLVDGGGPCAGRVEILDQGSWGTICDGGWDLEDARVVCRQLGCGEALDAPVSSYFGAGSGPIWLDNVKCTGKESHVWRCPSKGWGKHYCDHSKDAGVICSGFVHLAGGDGPCSGRVEVHSGEAWTPVSDGNFTLPTAQVICAELGCGKAVSVLGHVPFRESEGWVWAEEFRCEGEEPKLWFCPRVPCPGGTCHHSGAAQVVCSVYTEVRLMKNGTSQCEGQVEMNISGQWRALCASHWSLANANVVCRHLGCGVAISTPNGAEGSDRLWKARFHCSGAESFLWQCPVTALGVPGCSHGNTASVICSGNQTQVLPRCNRFVSEPTGSASSEESAPYCSDSRQLRLVDGGGPCAGRVEILEQGSWGTICDDGWDLDDARVVCRQLGCGDALNATGSAHFRAGSGPIWLDDLNCTGKESHVWRCPSRGWGRHHCRHKEDAGVICSEFLALRMVSEDQQCPGWLEVFYNGTWGSVCHSPMNGVTVSMICRQLGCGDSGSVNTSVGLREGSRPRWVDLIQCRKTDTSLWQCPSSPWKFSSCSPKEEAYISCAGRRPKSCPAAAPCTDREKLRLRGGDSECSGRVEVWHSGSWGTVCDDSWSLAEAEVVCQQLGCGPALEAVRAAAFGPGSGSIWLDEVRCGGRESSLWDCAAEPWGQSDCKHEEDAGVRCSGVRATLPATTAGTRTTSNPLPGIFSLPGVLCLILGALLFLVLVILVTQLLRWRAERRALSSYEDALAEAVYEELNYLVTPKEGLGSPDQRTDVPAENYNDVEEVPVPGSPPASQGSEEEVPPGKEDGVRSSQTGSSLNFSREVAGPGEGGASPWLLQGQKEDPGYDDVEFSALGTSASQWWDPALRTTEAGGRGVRMALSQHLSLQGLCVLLLGTVVGGQDLEVRLKDGAHRCEGRVEVKHQGEWGTVVDFDWSLKDASVVCRQLGCGAAVGIPKEAYFGPGLGPIWLLYTSCKGVESAVSDCKHSNIKDYHNDSYTHKWDAGVVCSGFVRLAGGDGPCSGRVEVHSGEAWTPVSDGNFTLPTAQVICAELGCGKAVSVLGHVSFRESDGWVWAEEFRCEGQEPELRVCPRVPCPGGTCHHRGAAQVVCSAYSEVRLMTNGSSQCEGQVEINISGRWRAPCASHWSLANANVVCRQLGCGVAISTTRGPHLVEGGDQILTSVFHCSGAEFFLWSCPVTALGGPDCSHGNTASVICSGNQTQVLPQCNHSMSEPAGSAASVESAPYCSDSRQLRLVDGGGPCAGRVEILDQGSWGTICDDGWDLDDARVVCRQLGCGDALNATRSAHFGAGSGPIWLDDLNCTGKESHVWRCPSQGWGRHDCRHKQDAGVICSEFLALRMVSEDQQCAGWLEVFYNGTWGSVCRNPMEDITVSVICRQLGCGDSGTLNSSLALREGSRPQWVDGIHCQKTDTSLWQCPSDPWNYTSCSPEEEAYISCEGDLLSISVCLSQPCRIHRQLRLVDGGGPCAGRVEILDQGSWGTICGYSWDLDDARVVCRQQGCGEALDAPVSSSFGAGSGPIWLDNVKCTGKESHVWRCPSQGWGKHYCDHSEDAGVICSGFVRLAGGDGPCSGRVEVHSGEAWTPVSDGNFTLPTAQVICAELGCGKAVSVLGHVPFRESDGQVWAEEFRCEGEEPELWSCPRVPCPGGTCQHSGAAQVVCSVYTEVRLMKNGTSQCEGRVEMNISGQWRALCASHWSLANANVVCRQLGCGVAISTPNRAKGSDQLWKARFHCSGAESFLWQCPVTALGGPDCSHGNTASVICSGNQTQVLPRCNRFVSEPTGSASSEESAPYCSDSRQLRLVDGGGPCAGRVEILDQGSWGTICDDGWDLDDARVVCRQLGCGDALNATGSAHFGAGSGPIWLDDLNCTGKESHVWRCPSRGWGRHDCRHKEDAGVVCSEFLALRMVSEDQQCAGWLEVFYNGTWGSLCHSPMDEVTVSIICRQLGCGDSGSLNTSVGLREGSRPRWVDLIQCRKTDTSLWQCPSGPWKYSSCSLKEEAYISCADREKLRLRGGDSECSGRVEVWHSGSWGTVCDDSWSLAEAEVVCQQLGCGPALEAVRAAAFGPGNGSIWLDEVRCGGRESSLWDCAAEPWGQSDCKHEEDAGVRCSGFVRLSGGDGPCSGRVEVHSGEAWIPVSDGNFTLPTAQVICAELGCGKAVSVLGHVPLRESDGRVWAEEFRCEGQEPELRVCPRVPCPGARCHHSGAAQVVCSAYSEVRLMINGSSQCEGQVEMNISGRWRALCASHWSLANANVVCRQLGCGVAISTPRGPHLVEGGDHILTSRFHCLGAESFLWSCPVTVLGGPDCSHGNTASVICSGNQTQVLPQCNYSMSEPAGSAASVESGAYCSDSRQLRLVDGGGPCAGRVEILEQGSWGTICDDGWDLDDARVVCRQLGCGEAFNATGSAHFGAGSGPIWLDDLNCTGKESQVWKCPSRGWGRHHCRHKQDAGVICSEFLALRMVSEVQQCAGWLEVFYNGSWGSVCRNPMEDITVSMICRQLGCGDSGTLNSSLALREGSRPRWVDGIHCRKTDTSLWQCPSDPWNYTSCSPKEEAYISCEGSRQLRLVDGGGPCAGRVEILDQGSWGTICDGGWDLEDARVVCRQLGCGEALDAPVSSYFGAGSGPIWLDNVKCTGKESHVWRCPSKGWGKHYCDHSKDAGVICSGFVHLAGGDGPCSGRVEVHSGEAWTPVSDGNFTLPTAQVICAELGCGKAVSVLGHVPFRESDDRVWAEEFRCEGEEPKLWSCPRVPCPGGTCQHSGAAQVVCSVYTEVRLMKNGTSQCEGQVEMNISGQWRALCASHWSLANANVVCRHLGCGVAISTPNGAEGSDRLWKARFHCSGAESFLWQCPVTALGVPGCSHGNTASVICSGNQTQVLPRCNRFVSEPTGSASSEESAPYCSDSRQLRLVDGGGPCAGRVEILEQGSWGTICDDGWDLDDARVVCRQLGCGDALNATGSAHFRAGSGPIWLDDLNCTGKESHVWRCPSRGWGRHHCRHKEDAGVICSEFLALRMVSEDQQCAGWLEVFYNGTWGSVCHSPMDGVTVSMICRQLGCGDSGSVNTSVGLREGSRPRWVDLIQCRKTDTSLWQCPSSPWKFSSCSPKEEAYISCAGRRPKSCPAAAPCTDREKLRLRGGDSECSGRVEVWHSGSWGTVCDDSWSLAEAEVVCQQLGCGPALEAVRAAAFGPGNGSIWLDEVRCGGRESSLWDCAADPWGQSDCKHEEDAGVRCSGVRTTLPATTAGTRTTSNPLPGIFSLPGVLCLILGALLFLVLIILVTQLLRWRAERRALSSYEDALAEAVYEELNYLVTPKEGLGSPGFLSDDSLTKRPYYTRDGDENSDYRPAPGNRDLRTDVPAENYDDVEEVPVPGTPPASQGSEEEVPPEKQDGVKSSQTGCSLNFSREVADPGEGGESPWLLQGQKEDPGYDDVEFSALGTSPVIFP